MFWIEALVSRGINSLGIEGECPAQQQIFDSLFNGSLLLLKIQNRIIYHFGVFTHVSSKIKCSFCPASELLWFMVLQAFSLQTH
jgi:hypothetical protein